MAPVVVAVAKFVAVKFATSAIFKAFVYIAGNILISKVAKALGPKAPRVTSQPIDIEYSSTVAARRIIYGENKVSGLNAIPAIVTGTKGEYLHQVLVLAGHEVNAISTVYFNDESLTLDGSGNVSGGSFSGKGSVRKYLGTSSQTVDSILNSAIPEWDTDHRGRGIAYLALRYTFDQEVYRNGKPDVTCIVQGKKCYDPRLDTSPGANPTNSAYAAYTANPALCLADYITSSYGLSEPASRIDWSAVVTAANICDEDVAIPGSTTQNRFTCNVVLEASTEFETNIETLAQAMMGACYYSGGKWRMYAGAWSTSAFTLNESDIVGEVSIQTAQSRKREGYYNAVRGQFIDKDRDYQQVEFEPILNSAYETQDGERIYTDAIFPACNNQYEAQRNAIILSRQSRRQKTVTVVCSLNAYKIRPFETGTVTIAEVGWSNQTVRCIGWRFRPEPAVELTLIEAASSDYSDPSSGTYVTPASVAVSDPATYSPGAPQSFTATQEIESILLSWAAPTNSVPGILYRVYQHTASTPFSSATQIYEGADTQLRVPRTDTNTRYFWVKSYYGASGGLSDETPSGAGLSSSGKIATISGYLTNEAVALSANSAGTIASYADAVGQFKLFSGSTDVTNLATFAIVSETNVDGDINTADNTPVSGQVKGYYRVTTLTGSLGVFKVSATYGGVTITKDFTVTKVQNGTDGLALNIYLTQTGIAIPADADGANPVFTNASTTVSIYEGQADVSSSWSVTASPSTGISGSLSTRTYTLSGMTVDTGYVEFTATRSGYSNLVIRLAVTKVKAGATGPAGPGGELGGISAFLSTDSAIVMAYADGTVTSFAPAVGQFQLYLGEENVTSSASFSATAENCTGTVNTADNTPVSGQPKGYYQVTAMTADTAKLTITASISTNLGNLLQEDGFDLLQEDGSFLQNEGFYSISRVFSIAKAKVGYEIVSSLPSTNLFEGRIVYLTTDNKLYRYDGANWVTSVAAVDISGTLADAQISALSASKITGQLSNAQLAEIAAAKVSGQLTNAQIEAIAATKITGQLANSQIADLAATKITGQLSDSQLAAISATKVSGQLTNSQLQDIASTKITGTLTSAQIASLDTAKLTGQITGTQITDGAISTAKISAGAVTANEITAGAITTAKIAAGAVTATEISAGAITTAKIAAGAVTAGEIAANAVTAAKISAGAVETAKLAAGAVTADTIATNAITSAKISAGAVETAKLAAGAVTADTIATNAITAAKIAAGAVETGKIAAGAVVADSIASNAITAVKISAGAVETAKLAAGAVVADSIASNAITAVKIQAGAVETAKIAAGAVTADTIAAAAVTTAKVAANAITANEISSSAITADKISAGAVTAAKISVTDLSAISATMGTVTSGTFQTGTSGYRVEVSSVGDFPIWYGSGTKNATNGLFYVKTDGSVYINAVVNAAAGSSFQIFRIDPATVSGSDNGFSQSGTVTSSAASLTLTNGTSPYTYLWTHLATTSGNTPTVSSSTAAGPTFSATAFDGEPSKSVWSVKVTDDKGAVAIENVYVTLIWTDIS